MWECPCLGCVCPVLLLWGLVLVWMPARLSSECAGHYPLDKGYDCHCGAQSRCWMLGGASSLLCGSHYPVGGRFCSPVVGVEALKVEFDQPPLPLSVCPAPEEVTAEAIETHVFPANLCTAHEGFHSPTQRQPKVVSLSPTQLGGDLSCSFGCMGDLLPVSR